MLRSALLPAELETLSRLLAAMPHDSGMAFVIIHHADPTHESLMADLLAKHTAMPVVLATDNAPVAPDHVYVIPPNCYLALEDDKLRLVAPEARHGLRLPIDFFLRSLASARRERAIAIILSGSGSDGALGVRAIKECGGMVIAQDPAEARHDGMPRSAIATNAVDHILPIAEMPARLIDYARHSYAKNGAPATVLGERARSGLADIIAFLRTQSPINFELYKEGTLLRRIERRMGLRHMEDTGQYLSFLKGHPAEARQLSKDLLISVTSFFRDPAVFEDLARNIIPELVRRHPADRPIRAWVAGCATGEEAYSIAMLLIEAASALRKDVKIQIFASDIDDDALATARDGRYPDAIEADVSMTRLQRFFIKEDHTYRVTPELREVIIFARQNLLSEPPFSKLDLIACRNVMIYLNPAAQDRIISMFHFALNEGGVLVLGTSETVGGKADQFQPVSSKNRIFLRIGHAHHGHIGYPTASGFGVFAPHTTRSATRPRPVSPKDLSQRALLEHYAPAAVLISDTLEALYFHGPTDRYVRVPPGDAKHGLLAMAREGLGGELGTAIRDARQRREVVVRSAVIRSDDRSLGVTITVRPIEAAGEQLMLVTFADQQMAQPLKEASVGVADQSALQLLERELRATKQELQNTISDLERLNEDLKAANEEAMSMNEEFQSTNEELETSKEELQSLNEELTTLNTQLQHKIEEERAISDDLSNLLSSSDIATIFLDNDLKIKRFTRPATKLFKMIATDLGRPFGDLVPVVDDPNLLADAATVRSNLRPLMREVQGPSGSWFNRRVLPYRTRENKVEGIVVTFADISDLKAAEMRAKAAQTFAENIVATVHEPLIVLDQNLRVISASASFYSAFATSPERTNGCYLFDLGNRQWDIPQLRGLLERVFSEKEIIEDFEVTHEFPRLGRRVMLLNARRIQGSDGENGLCLLAIEDVTQDKATERELLEREARLSAILAAVPDAVVTFDEHGTVGTFSAAAEHLFGFTAAEVVGCKVNMLMPEPHRSAHDGYLARYPKTGEERIVGRGREVIGQRKDGTTIPLRLSVAELSSPDQRIFVGVLHDMTEEKSRNEAFQRFQKMEAVGELAGGIAHDFNNILTIIVANHELLLPNLKKESERRLLAQATSAAEMGSRLTKRLLSLGHRNKLEPIALRVNDYIVGLLDVLRRTIGELITVTVTTAPDVWTCLADPSELENAILNLALNARDAMPNGGTLAIRTANERITANHPAASAKLATGDYVKLSISDTGIGMTPRSAATRCGAVLHDQAPWQRDGAWSCQHLWLCQAVGRLADD